MKGFKHISISITTYSCGTPTIFYWNSDGKHQISLSQNELSLDKALRIMWELVQAGGKKTVEVHPYCPTVTTREVVLWEF